MAHYDFRPTEPRASGLLALGIIASLIAGRTNLLFGIYYCPMGWWTGIYSEYQERASADQHYEFIPLIQVREPWASLPTIRFSQLLQRIQEEHVGILQIISEGSWDAENQGVVLVEAYGLAYESERNDALSVYRSTYGFTEAHLIPEDREDEAPFCHAITITEAGIDYLTRQLYPHALEGAIVFQNYCESYMFNSRWNALSVLGWSNKVCGLSEQDVFWGRMNGTRDRVYTHLFGLITAKTNKRRAVKDAVSGIVAVCTPPGGPTYYANLGYTGIGKVVLSPIVLNHKPWHGEMLGNNGYVQFDCEMNTAITANQIVRLTGVGFVAPPELQCRWAFNDNTKIQFSIPDLTGFGWADFQVHSHNAQSLHNHSFLDGDKNPPGAPPGSPPPRNGEGPNDAPGGDFYCWTGRVVDLPLITFEGHHDNGDPIGQHIWGLDFLDYVQWGYHFIWRFGETTPNSNVYPYFVPTQPPYPTYPRWWIDGRFASWIGTVVENPPEIRARIEISDPASEIYVGYSSLAGIAFMLYDSENPAYPNYIGHFANAVGNPIVEGIPLRHSLGQYRLYPNVQPDQPIDILEVDATENTFGIDNLMVNNSYFGSMHQLPPGFDIANRYCGSAQNGESNTHDVDVAEIADSLQVILNWGAAETLEMQLSVLSPNGETMFTRRSGEPPIMLDLVIADPVSGEWHAKVTVFSPETAEQHYALVAGVGYEPMVDGYFDPNESIKWHPESPQTGDIIEIFVPVHAGDQFDSTLEVLPVRCYLGSPDAGVVIDEDEYVMDFEPGGVRTVYYHLEPELYQGTNPCQIVIVIDPDGVIDEYDENNNEISRLLYFPE